MQEIWCDIEGYEGLYQVSNMRRIKSLNYRHTGKEGILKRRKDKGGYLQVILWNDGEYKRSYVHRLVAQTFLTNPENYPEVNHKDENKQNNCIENLEWCTSKYNNNYGSRIEKTSKPVVCVETGEVFNSGKDAQEKTGICVSNITRCARHKKYFHTAGGFHWEYV